MQEHRLLETIKNGWVKYGAPPSMGELLVAMGWMSRRQLTALIWSLVQKGYIRKSSSDVKSIELVE